MADGTWSLAEAKAKLSEVVERAEREGPQHLTKHGRETAVILSAETFRRLQPQSTQQARSLADVLFDPRIRFFTDEEHDALFSRDPDPGRPIDL